MSTSVINPCPGHYSRYAGHTFDDIMETITERDILVRTDLSVTALEMLSRSTGISHHALRNFALKRMIPSRRHFEVLSPTWLGKFLLEPDTDPITLLGQHDWTVIEHRVVQDNGWPVKFRQPLENIRSGDFVLTHLDGERQKPGWILIHHIDWQPGFAILYGSESSVIAKIPISSLITFTVNTTGYDVDMIPKDAKMSQDALLDRNKNSIALKICAADYTRPDSIPKYPIDL